MSNVLPPLSVHSVVVVLTVLKKTAVETRTVIAVTKRRRRPLYRFSIRYMNFLRTLSYKLQ